MLSNHEIAARFERISRMLALLGEDAFRVNAHARAARAIEGHPEPIAPLADDHAALTAIDGIGARTAAKIAELVRTGDIAELRELSARVPPGLPALLEVPGLGPKTVKLLWDTLGVVDLAGLERVIADGSILTLPRMGEKAVQNLKASLEFARSSAGRLPLGVAAPLAERIAELMSRTPGVVRVQVAGSLRRGRDTVGDIDVLVASDDPARAHEAFRTMPGVARVLASGDTRTSVRMSVDADLGRLAQEGEGEIGGVQVDLRVVPAAAWGAAVLYFTGSKEHNVRLRELALRAKLTLNEYGLFPLDDDPEPPQARGVAPLAAETEADIYRRLGLPEIPPELREDRGELALESAPRLIELADVRAELHAHTTASDGELSIEELAREAQRRGMHTIAVTDHSRSSAIANGLDIDRLMAHVEEVRRVASRLKGIAVLAGSEVDILADGSLDYPDEVLRELDVVVASPHVALSQDGPTATRRLLAAIRHPLVHILGHPTGRLIGRRAGMEPDIGALVAAAVEHRVALEINAHWLRLDLRDVHVRAATSTWASGEGCLIAIDCDVHAAGDFDNLRFGVQTGRRGWLEPRMCVNTWGARELRAWLRSKR